MEFLDYYENIEEISPSLSREENLEKLKEAMKVWRKRVGDEARIKENFINAAITVFSDYKKYEKFRNWWEERQPKTAEVTPEEEFRELVRGAAIDKVITNTEYQRLLEKARQMGIPEEHANTIINEIADNLGIPIGEVETQPSGEPVLKVDRKYIKFENVKLGSNPTEIIGIDNIGGGINTGHIKTNVQWLIVSPNKLDTTKHRQDIIVTLETSGFQLGEHKKGKVIITSKGGNATIDVDVIVEGLDQKVKTLTGISVGVVSALSLFYLIFIFSTTTVSAWSIFGLILTAITVWVLAGIIRTRNTDIGCGWVFLIGGMIAGMLILLSYSPEIFFGLIPIPIVWLISKVIFRHHPLKSYLAWVVPISIWLICFVCYFCVGYFFISKEFISKELHLSHLDEKIHRTSDVKEPSTTYPLGTIIADRGANIRSGPGTEYSIIGKAQKGDIVVILSKNGAWYKVRYHSKVGYIYSTLILEL